MTGEIVPTGPIIPPADIRPNGPIQSPASVGLASDAIRGGASGLSEGAAGLAGLPRTIGDMEGSAANWLMEKAGVPEDWRSAIGSGARTALSVTPLNSFVSGPTSQDVKSGIDKMTSGYTDYTPQSYTGKTVKEVASLVPVALTAGITGGVSAIPEALAVGAVAPGVLGTAAGEGASKVASMLGVEDPQKYGNIARNATEFVTPWAANKIVSPIASLVKNPSIAPEMQTRADALRGIEESGINTTAGNYSQHPGHLANEMSYPKTRATLEGQLPQYTDFLLRESGLPTVQPGNNLQTIIEDGRQIIGSDIGHIASTTPISPTVVQNATQQSPDRAAAWADRLKFWQSTGKPVNGDTIQAWRSDVSRDTRSFDPATREKAKDALEMIDDIISGSLKAAGRADDWTYMGYLRNKYRNVLALEDAAEKSRMAGFENVVLPKHMYSSLKTQGAKSLVRGGRDAMGEVTKDALNYLPGDLSRIVEPGKGAMSRVIRAGLDAGLGIGAATLGYSGGAGPVGSALLGGLGAAGSEGMRTLLRGAKGALVGSQPVQNALKRAALSSSAPQSMMPYALAPLVRPDRKSGGRVSTHDAAADQLVRAAERAKKGQSAQTEALLQQPDSAVAHALEVANRSI